jgi:methylthioribulose-1-phosphate dehydratase
MSFFLHLPARKDGVLAHLILQVALPREDNFWNITADPSAPSRKFRWQAEHAIIRTMTGARKRSANNPIRRSRRNDSGARFHDLADSLAEIGRSFYQRGWVFGTSGNFSAVVSERPLRLAITPTGLDKGALDPEQFLEIDEAARVVRGNGLPSAETGLHLTIVRTRGAGAVLHTHSLWSTVLSDVFSADGAVALEGFEMLKGLRDVHTHEHREILPILENCQDIAQLAEQVQALLKRDPAVHGFLLRRHGLYTWGQDLAEAKRHVEVLEFLLEILGRSRNGV